MRCADCGDLLKASAYLIGKERVCGECVVWRGRVPHSNFSARLVRAALETDEGILKREAS